MHAVHPPILHKHEKMTTTPMTDKGAGYSGFKLFLTRTAPYKEKLNPQRKLVKDWTLNICCVETI